MLDNTHRLLRRRLSEAAGADLGRGRHVALHCKMRQKRLDVLRTEFSRVASLMETDEPAYPFDIGGFRPDAVVFEANLVPDTVQE